MSDIDTAVKALKNAIAAGSDEDAKKIAQAIKGMQAQTQMPAPREEIGDVSGMAAHASQGALMGFGDEYMAGLSSVLGVQPDGRGGANWFDYSKPIGERYDTALGAIRDEMGEYSEENPWKAGGAQVAGAIGTAVVAAPKISAAGSALGLKAAATTGSRVRRMAAGGAGAGFVEGFGSGEGGAGERLKSAAIGAGVGTVFAPIAGFGISKVLNTAEKLFGGSVRAVFSNRRMYNRNSGALTESGKKRLAALGYDDIEKMSQEMQSAMGIAAERITGAGDDVATGAALGRLASAERFGVPLTTGQATGDVGQTALEESMRAKVRGQGAYDTMTGFDATQRAAVDQARESVVPPPGASVDRIDAAEAVTDGVRREAEAARVAGASAYQALEESGAALDGTYFPQIQARISDAVKSEGFAIDAGTPNAQAALSVLETAFNGAERGAVPFKNIERARQRMSTLRRSAQSGNLGADKIAIDRVISEFDGFLDDTITDALIQGDAAVIGQAKNARGLWAKYRSTFLGKEGADNFIRKIVEDDLAPDQVAGWLYGSSTNIGGGQSSLVARRVKDILGADSQEWAAVKSAGWGRITQNTEGKDAWGPQKIASNISELIDGKGKTLARELYTPQEIAVMREFRDMLKVLVPPARSTNPSGTSYQNQRAVIDLVRNMGVLVGGATGGPAGAVGAAVTSQAMQGGSSFAGTLRARAATRGITFKASSVPVAVGAGVATGAAVQDQTIR